MGLALTGSSWVLQDNQGASEVVLDVDFAQMANASLSDGTNTLTLPDGNTIDAHIFIPGGVNTPQLVAIRNGQGLSFRTKNDASNIRYARIYFDITGSINAGKTATDPGRYNPRDRLIAMVEVSGTTITNYGSISFGITNGIIDGADSAGGSFAGTGPAHDYIIPGIGPNASNSNKLTPIAYLRAAGSANDTNYITGSRAVTAGHTYIILQSDVREGEGWYRFKTGSVPLGDYATNLPTPADLVTFAHARTKASVATEIANDNSPFTGSVLGVFTLSSGAGTANAEFSGSITRLAILRYGAVK